MQKKKMVFVVLASVIFMCSQAFAAPKTIELIIDASGSMKAKLSSGETKIHAAKTAVKALVENLADDVVLAFRAYGHQSLRQQHNCEDTQLLSDFAPLGKNRRQVVLQLEALKAQGYTPITYVLELAAKDFPQDTQGNKTIILVSDGQETCEGDPCALAAALAKAKAHILIHTVGFGVDSATQSQLECIARATGGTYFGAANTQDLIAVLGRAVEAKSQAVKKKEGTGTLQVLGANLSGHTVTNAQTGEKFEKTISRVNETIQIPAGIYNVTIGKSVWKSVEVKAGEKTVLKPGWLSLKHASHRGHKVQDAETGIECGSVSSSASTLALIPGNYEVLFGSIPWPVKIEEGQTSVVNPGVVNVKGAHYRGHKITDNSGQIVGSVSNTSSSITLPPGNYTIEIDEKKVPFVLREGELLTLERK